ncbi:uncharacterized protein TrAtP1_001353 [Trichoderma atroviride]|uniref:uncharacterized protein n=1 Tax=Hypocrea atroviridis TaxID=63577 RepID=UPI00332398DF|nr:hypothetical protein TrAtP1_001353 [Trichoderma atroviride]
MEQVPGYRVLGSHRRKNARTHVYAAFRLAPRFLTSTLLSQDALPLRYARGGYSPLSGFSISAQRLSTAGKTTRTQQVNGTALSYWPGDVRTRNRMPASTTACGTSSVVLGTTGPLQ